MPSRLLSRPLSLDSSTSLSSYGATTTTTQWSLRTPSSTIDDGDEPFEDGLETVGKGSSVRKRLSLLNDFSTFLRSRSGLVQSDQPTSLVLSDYADISNNDDKMYTASQPRDDERSTNRVRYTSRSRSRSKQSSSNNDVHVQSTESAQEYTSGSESHSRESTWSSRTSDRGRSSHRSSAKPSTILPSRPLSSTTTATNATVTPPTPKGKKRMAQMSTALPPSSLSETSHENSHPNPSTSSPEPALKARSSTRRKLRNIFGIHSRKSSMSSSRGTSPSRSHHPSIQQPTEIPPLPPYPSLDTFASHPSHFTSAQSPDPVSSSRPHSPSPQSQSHHDPLTSSVSTTASSTSKIDHFTKFFSSGTRSRPLLHPHRTSTTSLSTPPSSSDSIIHTVSSPKHKRASTSASDINAPHIHSSQNHKPMRNGLLPKAAANGEASGSNGQTTGSISRHSHSQTPVTNPSSRSSTTSPPRLSHRKDSADSGYRYRPLVMVDEERERESLDNPGPKGKGKELVDSNTTSRAGKRRGSESSDPRPTPRSRNGGQYPASSKAPKQVSIRATKHGSFDFERPSWAIGISRSLSGGGQPRPNDESSGNGRAKGAGDGRLEQPERRENGGTAVSGSFEAWKRQRPTQQQTPPSTSKGTRPHQDETPTPTTSGKGQSSSLGKSAGKRALGSGVTRLVGLAHGPFSFEPAVPSPTYSQTSASTAHGHGGDTEREGRDKRKRPKEAAKEGDLLRSTSTKSKATEPDSILTTTSGSSRYGPRGRSLDLGLGLSWAPTKVREDVLLPAGSFVSGKSRSAPSRKGLAQRHVEFQDQERTKVGQEIAEVFKKVLDEDAYIAFKHYVHQFDAHEIPFDGPSGIIAKTERLLGKASTLGPEDQQNLVNKLIRVILHNT
ncbi:hypothetical protein PQX77_005047 [Marasmius sp. AFHP31]|nr:hypothetical protein PQX77_005047 [Marasmius sp. AFHP31]